MTKRVLLLALLCLMILTGCEAGRSIDPIYPRIEYRNSSYNFDPYNREIPVEEGFVLDEGHSYDLQETENGYDIVLHFVMDGGNNED